MGAQISASVVELCINRVQFLALVQEIAVDGHIGQVVAVPSVFSDGEFVRSV